MTAGDEGLPAADQAIQEGVHRASDAAGAMATDAAAQMQSATAAVADHAETMNKDGARAASATAASASEAFGAARDRLNAMAESLPQAGQDFFRPFRSGGEALGKSFESSYATTMEGMAEFNSKAIAAWRSNTESMVRHWQSLATVKSLSEAIALNAEHTRSQLEVVTSQTRELSALATRIMRDAVDPLKMVGR